MFNKLKKCLVFFVLLGGLFMFNTACSARQIVLSFDKREYSIYEEDKRGQISPFPMFREYYHCMSETRLEKILHLRKYANKNNELKIFINAKEFKKLKFFCKEYEIASNECERIFDNCRGDREFKTEVLDAWSEKAGNTLIKVFEILLNTYYNIPDVPV